ncbi:hypothetical protein RRG08_066978 [Elysia crispata]|uniref:WD repeat-containing protein 60 n=1 Tax=Elysia crispata TaxID=231223 RepID=A0AAE0ZA49_9GAST|nr:hypothetical protein RRG08_066978 [Elysia crispata]
MKGSKDDMLRKKRRDEEGGHRRHREEVNGSDHRRRDGDKDRHRSKSHKDRGDSPDHTKLSELHGIGDEDRERLRQERRAKKEGVKEEKPSRHKESSKATKVIDSDDDDRKRRHHRDRGEDGDKDRHEERRHHRDRDEERERRHHREKDEGVSGSRRHRDDKEERRNHDRDKDHKRDRDHRRKDDEDREHRRHRDEDDDNRRRRHHDEGSDRRKRKEEDSRRLEDDDEERERRRQERREKREKEKSKEKENDREKERSHRRSERKTEDDEDHDRRRKERSDRDRDKEKEREREKRKEREREDEAERHRKRETQMSTSNGRHKMEEEENDAEEDEDDYNYEEDFEDYEDDFEDDEDPEMKEEGEMEEVLRALDEENNRLASTSRRSNWSDSTELSDERFKDNHEDEPRSRAAPRTKTFINFISAKQRVMDNTVAGRVRKRFEDLSKLIELDVSAFDMFDLPPVKEYELYIRSFGRSDTQQAYVQTRDDDVDRDIQTEEIEVLSKWTQHPPDEDTAVGGEGINVQALDQSSELVKKTDPAKVTQFLDRVGQWLFTVLEEESGEGDSEERRDRESRPTASFSESVSQLGQPNFLAGRNVLGLSFCSADPNSLLSIHSSLSDGSEENLTQLSTFSVICVWNLSHPAYPQRICGSEMQITCACFSPTKASLVFGGMRDGSVALWDLREPGSLHHSFELDGLKHLVRFPTYNTAGISECHHSPVVSIAAVYSNIVGSLKDEDMAESSSGLSFQLASVDEKATVNLWVVAEIAVPEMAGSMHDLGLSPGGKIKIMKSSSIAVNNPSKYLSLSPELKALDLQLNPGDLNHFYVGTDVGCVVHGVRFGSRVYPQSHSSLVDSPVPIVSIDFSPFGQPYFLAGCRDGTLHLFNTKMECPVATWREFVSGESILSVRWSTSRPAVFFVLDNNSTVFTFDLVENGLTPIKMDRITKADAMIMEVGGDPNLITPGVNRPAYMVFALDDGSTEILTISRAMREQQPLEEDFLATYVDRY